MHIACKNCILCNFLSVLYFEHYWFRECELYTVNNMHVNLTELPGSPSKRQYYIICHILTANLR